MRHQCSTISAVGNALERDAVLHLDKASFDRAVEVIECLALRGFEIVMKPPGKDPAEILRRMEAEQRRAEELSLAQPTGIIDRNLKPSQAEPDDEPEEDTWGVCARLADDMAARHGCRVELSGRENPKNPNTYYDDNATYAVVTDRSTGRLVGLVECWDTEDGDPIVPQAWLKAVLLAWRAESTPKRAA